MAYATSSGPASTAALPTSSSTAAATAAPVRGEQRRRAAARARRRRRSVRASGRRPSDVLGGRRARPSSIRGHVRHLLLSRRTSDGGTPRCRQQFVVGADRGDRGRRTAARRGRPAARWTAGAPRPARWLRQHLAQRGLHQGLGVHVQRGQRVVEHQERRAARPPRGPARAAAAGRRTASAPARRPGCPGPAAAVRRSRHWATCSAAARPPSSAAPGAPIATFSRTVAENSVGSSKATATTCAAAQRESRDIDAVERDPAAGHVVQPRDQRGERGLARSRWRRPAPSSRRAGCAGRRRAASGCPAPG